jgi:hypothetical protein
MSPKITTREKLHQYLQIALQVEHATIPPYLTALYSIKPTTNPDAVEILRVIVVEEMLHLTLAANILNAVGGKPNLTAPGFVPLYPAYLPNGEDDFLVDLQPFSKDAVNTFLKIERPGEAPNEASRLVSRKCAGTALCSVPGEGDLHFYSIGEFYEEISLGLQYLHEKMASGLFSGDKKKQITSEYYYSGGGELFPVTDFDSAVKAVQLIKVQGEGLGEEIYTKENELSHDYRFEQLLRGQYYQRGDTKTTGPRGDTFTVDWEAVYPLDKNPRLSCYERFPELHAAAFAFNKFYANLLKFIQDAFNGQPQLLLEAVPLMLGELRNRFTQLIHVPVPGLGLNAAPTFEIAGVTP